jgi:integrase
MGLGGKSVGPATQTGYLAVIKHVLATAKREWEWLSDNPAGRVRSPKEPPGRDRFLSREERAALLDACRTSRERRLYPLVVLALSTGGREGELPKLAWRDVDLASGRATVRGKNGDKRGLTVNSPASASLRELASVRQLGSDLVFANARGVATFPQDAWMASASRRSTVGRPNLAAWTSARRGASSSWRTRTGV